MLALITPMPQPSLHPPESSSSPTMTSASAASTTTTSTLTILSPVHAFNRPSSSSYPSPRRPKLSLNTETSQARTFGKGSTSLNADALSAASPTSRNTFSNAYQVSQRLASQPSVAKPAKPGKPRLFINSSVAFRGSLSTPPPSAQPHTPALSAVSSGSSESLSSAGSISIEIPYKPSHGLRSILSNGPFPFPARSTKMSSFATTRPIFPPAKRVSFRDPLDEEIKTTRYTLAHSDLTSSSSSGSTVSSLASTGSAHDTSPASSPTSSSGRTLGRSASPAVQPAAAGSPPRAGGKRDSESESDDGVCPQTPVAGRRKRRREWVWTLGPIDKVSSSSSTTPSPSSSGRSDGQY